MDSASRPPVLVPADIDLEDKYVAGLTARQLTILLAAGLVVYFGYTATRTLVPLMVFVLVAVPVSAGAIALALGRRDGISLDRYLLGAASHWWHTRRLTDTEPTDTPPRPGEPRPRPELDRAGHGLGQLRVPVRPVTAPVVGIGQAPGFGVVDAGSGGLLALAAVSSVSFALRSNEEQQALVGVFARWLHSLTHPAHLMIRALPQQLTSHIARLDHAAATLPNPALAAAAGEHAEHLAQLALEHQLLHRRILLVLREPASPSPPGASAAALARRDRAAMTRLARRLAEAAALLAPAGLTVTPLDAHRATTILTTTDHGATAPGPFSDRDYDPDEVADNTAGDAVAVAVDDARANADEGELWYPLQLGGSR